MRVQVQVVAVNVSMVAAPVPGLQVPPSSSQLLLCHQLHNIWTGTNTELPFAVLTVGYVMTIYESIYLLLSRRQLKAYYTTKTKTLKCQVRIGKDR